jgi:hypothetical protein
MAMVPARRRRQHNNDASTATATTMPARHENGTSAKTAMMPIATHEDASTMPSDDGNSASATRTLAPRRQQFPRDGGEGVVAMSARTPALQLQRWQQRKGDGSNDASTVAPAPGRHRRMMTSPRQQQHAIATTATTPAPRRQRCNDNNATAKMPD